MRRRARVLFFLFSVTVASIAYGAMVYRRNAATYRLVRAIERESLRDVQEALAEGADPNGRVDKNAASGFSLLRSAKRMLRMETAELYPPPAVMAMACDKTDILRTLVEHGANIRARTEDGRTILMEACWQGDFELAREAVRRGVDLRAVESTSGFSALHLAARSRNPACARLLLDLGADPNMLTRPPNAPGWAPLTPLCLACGYSNVKVVQLLLSRGADPRFATSPSGMTAFHMVGYHKVGDHDRRACKVAELLIVAGADPKATMSNGTTTLMRAVNCFTPSLCRLLISRGVPVNATAKDGWTAISHWANPGGDEETCLVLLEHGADPNLGYHYIDGPLAHAIVNKMPRAYRALLKHGASVKPQHPQDWNPMACAVQMDDPEAVRLLVAAGADPRAKGADGMTHLEAATKGRLLHAKAALEECLRLRKPILP